MKKNIKKFELNNVKSSLLQNVIGGHKIGTRYEASNGKAYQDIWYDNNDNEVFDSGDCFTVTGNEI